jgi:multiple sugar transport system substrate-binding protein
MRLPASLVVFLILMIALSACDPGAGPTPATAPVVATSAEPGAHTPPSASPAPAATSATTEQITISFAASEEERPIYEPLIAAFEAENPGIRVQLVNIERAAETITMPDGGQMTMIGPGSIRKVVSMADTAVGISPTPEAIAKGWVHDLAPLIDADAAFDSADFYPGLLAPDQAGHIYLLPAKIYLDLLAYNKELWAQRGMPPPRPDWTWSDLKAAAAQLARKRGSRVEVYGMLDWSQGIPALLAELAEAGVRLDPARPLRLDDSTVVAALERVVVLTRSGAYSAEGEFQQLILNQQAGIWATTPNMLDADQGASAPKPSFAIGTVPRPLGYRGISGFLISGGTAHPVEAWRWLAFLSRQAIGEPDGHGDPAGAVPARRSVADRSGFWKRLDAEMTAALQAALAEPTTASQLPELGLDLNGEVLLRGALSAAIHGEKTPAVALREAQAALDRLLAQAPPTPAPAGDQIVVDTPVPAAPVEAVRVTYGALRPAVDQLRELARAFNQRNPAVVVEIKSIEPAPTLRLANLAAHLDCLGGLGPPGPSDSASLLDLQPLIDADAAFPRDDYPPMLLAPFAQGGRLLGLPYAVDFRVLNYNQTAFDAAKLAYPDASWTLDDMLHAAQRLTSGAGQTRRYGFASTVLQAQDVFFFLDHAGASAATGNGASLRPSFTDPQVAQAIRTYLDLLRASSPHQRLSGYMRGELQTDAVELVSAGRVGMWFDFGAGFFGLGRLRTPDFVHAIAPPPLGGAATSNDFRVSGLYIAAQTPHPEACWAWLKHLSEQSIGLGGAFPARRSVAESPAFVGQALPGAAEVYKAYQTAMEYTSGAAPPQAGPEIDYYWFLRAVDRGLQGADLERELDDAQRITEEYLACVQGGATGSVCAKQVDASYQGWQDVGL